jgi:hypothetical protein
MKIITLFKNYLILEASQQTKDLIDQTYQQLYDVIQQTDSDKLNIVKNILYKYPNAVLKNQTNQIKLLNATDWLDFIKVIAEINKSKTQNITMTPMEQAIRIYPDVYRDTIRKFIKNVNHSVNNIKMVGEMTKDLRLAIESQNRVEDLVNAKTLEEFQDILMQVKSMSNAYKWINELLSSPVKEELKEIDNVKRLAGIISGAHKYFEYYKHVILKKTKMLKTVEEYFDLVEYELNQVMSSKIDILNSFKPFLNGNGLKIEHDDGIYLVVWIYSYEASNTVGRPNNWCISYPKRLDGPGYFKNYVLKSFNKQYFIWDFTEKSTSLKYNIGVTIDRETGEPNYCHLTNDNSCMDYVENFGWYKYLHNLTSSEVKIWYDYLIKNNVKIDNPEIILEYSIASNDINTFSNSFNTYKNNYISNPVKLKMLLLNIVENNLMDFLKIVTNNLNSRMLLPGFGTLLIKAYNNGNKEMFNYLKNLVDKRTLMVLKNSAIKNEEMNKYLEYYQKTL